MSAVDPERTFVALDSFPRHGNLGQLESNIAAMADNFRTDLDQLLPERGYPSSRSVIPPHLLLLPLPLLPFLKRLLGSLFAFLYFFVEQHDCDGRQNAAAK